MSALIPEKRPDRNGKMVTRHVRTTAPTSPSQGFAPPVPATSPALDPKALKSLVNRATDALNILDGEGYGADVRETLPDMPSYLSQSLTTETGEAYLAAIGNDPSREFAHVLLSVISRQDDDLKARYILEIARRPERSDHTWSLSGNSSQSYLEAERIYKGMHDHYGHLGFVPPEDIFSEADPEVPRTIALIEATQSMMNGYGYYSFSEDCGLDQHEEDININDDGVVQLVLDYPENAKEIGAEVARNGVASVSFLRGKYTSASPAVREGFL